MVKIERDALIDAIAAQTELDADTLDELGEDAIQVLFSAAADGDDGEPAPDPDDVEGGDGEVTGAASASGRSSGLLAEDTVRAAVDGRIDASAFDDDTLFASVDAVYGDDGPQDYTTGIDGDDGDVSMSPEAALLAAQSPAGSDAADADASADPSDYSAGTEGDA